ncbi:MAG: hypothetical protein HY656_00655 [Acidobacteria bacterium]|nr:hypothetical protein [Acidobacteriota bacterium]
METTATEIRFRLQLCERCGRETIHAMRDPSTPLPSTVRLSLTVPSESRGTSLRASGASDYRICSGCDPAAFERAAFEAGRKELLR